MRRDWMDRSSGGQWWIWPGEDGPASGAGGGNSTCRFRCRTSLTNIDPDDRTARREGPEGIAAAGQVWQVRPSWGHERLIGKDGSPGSLDGPAPEAGGWAATVLYPVNIYNTQKHILAMGGQSLQATQHRTLDTRGPASPKSYRHAEQISATSLWLSSSSTRKGNMLE